MLLILSPPLGGDACLILRSSRQRRQVYLRVFFCAVDNGAAFFQKDRKLWCKALCLVEIFVFFFVTEGHNFSLKRQKTLVEKYKFKLML